MIVAGNVIGCSSEVPDRFNRRYEPRAILGRLVHAAADTPQCPRPSLVAPRFIADQVERLLIPRQHDMLRVVLCA